MMDPLLMIQVVQVQARVRTLKTSRYLVHRSSRIVLIVATAPQSRVTLSIDGAIGGRVDPLASALAARIQTTDNVYLLVRVVSRSRHAAALVVVAQMVERASQAPVQGVSAGCCRASGLPFGSEGREVDGDSLEREYFVLLFWGSSFGIVRYEDLYGNCTASTIGEI